MLAGLLSVVAAGFYVVGLALQQEANLESPVAPAGWFSTARRVVLQPRWLGGFALTAIGFVLHGTALSIGSLTTVQVLQTSQIIFMVPLSARVAGVAVRPQDWRGAAMVGVGLLALLVAVRPTEDTSEGSPDGWAATVVIGAAVVATVVAAGRVRPELRAPLYGLAAGIVFGIEGATLKVVSDDLAAGITLASVVGLAVWATLGLATAGVVLQNLALRAGHLSVALSTMTIASPVTSTAIGVALFGERLDLTPATVAVAVAATLLAAGGVMVLSRAAALEARPAPVAPAL